MEDFFEMVEKHALKSCVLLRYMLSVAVQIKKATLYGWLVLFAGQMRLRSGGGSVFGRVGTEHFVKRC